MAKKAIVSASKQKATVDVKKKVLNEVRKRLSKTKLPSEIVLNNHTKIIDPEKFFESHIILIENGNTESLAVKPYSERFKKALEIVGINIREIAKQIN